jgi:hypothetical protein
MKNTLAALGMLAAAASAQGAVQQQLEVKASRYNKIAVTLTIQNGSGSPVYVPKAAFEDKELFGRLFDVRMKDGGEVQYIGPMVKRGPYTQDDYVMVPPGGKRSNTIDITHSYQFKKGTHQYTVSYSGGYLGELQHLDATIPADIPPVPITYTGK